MTSDEPLESERDQEVGGVACIPRWNSESPYLVLSLRTWPSAPMNRSTATSRWTPPATQLTFTLPWT